MKTNLATTLIAASAAAFCAGAQSETGKLLLTGGVSSIDGTAGSGLLIRPCEVSSGITYTAVLKVANNPLWVLLQHRHVLTRCSTQFGLRSHRHALAHLLL